jgi:hypothetical protein
MIDNSEPENGFTIDDVTRLISGMVDDRQLSNPDDQDGPYLHFVIMPRSIEFTQGGPPQITGFHFSASYPRATKKLYIACLLFAPRFHISSSFSHELVEACTDPEGRGIKITSHNIPLNGRDEISDICEDHTPQGKVNGVKVQSYWSQNHQSCIIPK